MGIYASLWATRAARRYATRPPAKFAAAMGLQGCSSGFVQAAWQLFKDGQEPARITKELVRKHLREQSGEAYVLDDTLDKPVGAVNLHFLDSGSFSLWTKGQEWFKENGGRDPYGFYHTDEFMTYLDAYGAFIKKYQKYIDLYANVDVIPEPHLTLRSQKYLEAKGLTPVPVVHYRTKLKWLEYYIKEGHGVVALGGLVGSTDTPHCRAWLDAAFRVVCDQPSGLPRVRVHGFGVTAHDLMIRYPWWSVDSTSWTQVGGFGGVFVPKRTRKGWEFLQPPVVVKTSGDSPERLKAGRHYASMSLPERAWVRDWLAEIKVPLGTVDADHNVIEHGVLTRYVERWAANLKYYERFRAALPAYPWPFRVKAKAALGLVLK